MDSSTYSGYDVPSDEVIELLKDVELDTRTQEQICAEFKLKKKKIVFNYEIIPVHLKWKSKIMRQKKTVTLFDQISVNRTYLERDDYQTLHSRVVKHDVQMRTARAICVKISNVTENVENEMYVRDRMIKYDDNRSIYILTVEIAGDNIDLLNNEETHMYIGDIIQHHTFNTLVLINKALLVRPVFFD